MVTGILSYKGFKLYSRTPFQFRMRKKKKK